MAANQQSSSSSPSTNLFLSNPALTKIGIDVLEAEIARRARHDSSLFTAFVMQDPETGLYFKQSPVHEKWHRCFDKYVMNLIEAHRESGKSAQVAARLVWEAGNDPNIRIKYITDTDKMASQRLKSIADLIEHNRRVHLVFPELKPDYNAKWDLHGLIVKRTITGISDPTIGGYGVMSTGGVGGRATLTVFDDVVTLENTIIKPALIPQVKYAYREKWMNTKTRSGRVIYIFTPWHEADLSHELIKESTKDEPREGQYHLTVDLVDREKMISPFPEMWPQSRLYARLDEIKERAFMRNFCGKAMSQDESLFDAIDLCCDYDFRLSDIHESWMRYVFTGIDLGHRKESQKKDAAYTVIFTGILAPQGGGKYLKIPIDIRRGRWGPVVTADQILDVYQRYKSQLVLVENNGYQDSIREWIDERATNKGIKNIPTVKGYFTGTQKLDEVIGLPGLAVDIENQNWKIPMAGHQHLPECECQYCGWIREMKMYPVSEFKDRVIACWLFWQACREGSSGPSDIQSTRDEHSAINEMSDYGV